MQTTTIGIDARAATEVPAGRGRYVRELLRGLTRLPDPDVRFVLWARTRWEEPLLDADPRFSWRLVGLPDPIWHLAVAVRAGGQAFLSTNSYLTAWATRVPTAITVYDLVAFDPQAHVQARAGRIERATIRPALRRAAALVCISEATRAELVRLFPHTAAKSCAVPLAADPQFAAPVPERPTGDDRPYVLGVGTLEPRKNLERLVAAWQRLPADVREAHRLVLVGPRGWSDEPILAAAEAAGAELTGRVSDEELHALYAGARVFLYPSLAEGFGLPVLEAMAAGVPVVTSNVSSMPEVAGDAALLVDPRDEAAIGGALERLLADGDLRADLSRRGRERAGLFSWERTARETLDVLYSIGRRRR